MDDSEEQRGSVRRALYWLHSVTGVSLGLLALVVFFTGAIAVFSGELEAWAGRARPIAALEQMDRPELGALVDRLSAQVEPAWREEVSIFQRPSRPLILFFHTHGVDAWGKVVERGARFDVDPASHQVLQRRDGIADDVFEPSGIEALSHFFVDLHVQLLIPEPVGLYATGVVGFALMVLLLTGVLVHRRFLAEAFRVRRQARPRQLYRDLHTATGVWLLPYGAVLAFTGAFFSFGDALLLPALAKVAFSGNELALQEALVGEVEHAGPRTPTAGADLDAVLRDARRRAPGAHLGFMALAHRGQSGSTIDIGLGEVGARVAPAQLRYDGVTGAFVRERSPLGTGPSVGGAIFSWMGPLHYGNFGGPLSRILWAFLGIGCCVLTCTGTLVWSERRRESRRASGGAPETMRRLLAGTMAGMPLATFGAVLAWAAALRLSLGAIPAMGLTAGLLLALSILLALRATSLRRTLRGLLRAAGALAVALPLLAMAATGATTLRSWNAGNPAPALVDAALLVLGFGLFQAARLLGRSAAAAETAPARPALAVGELATTEGRK